MWYDALKKGVQTFCQGPSTDCEPYLPFVFRLSSFVKTKFTQKGVFQFSSSCTNQWMHSWGTPNTNHKGSHPHPMWKLITNLDITQEVLQFSSVQFKILFKNVTKPNKVFFYHDGCSFCCQCLIFCCCLFYYELPYISFISEGWVALLAIINCECA